MLIFEDGTGLDSESVDPLIRRWKEHQELIMNAILPASNPKKILGRHAGYLESPLRVVSNWAFEVSSVAVVDSGHAIPSRGVRDLLSTFFTLTEVSSSVIRRRMQLDPGVWECSLCVDRS